MIGMAELMELVGGMEEKLSARQLRLPLACDEDELRTERGSGLHENPAKTSRNLVARVLKVDAVDCGM